MKKVKCNVARLTITGLITHCIGTAKRLQNNPLFPNPNPSPQTLLYKANEVSNALSVAINGSRQARLYLKQVVNELRDLLRKTVLYVNQIAFGKESVIIAAGFLVSDEKHMSQELPDAPAKVKAVFTDMEGQILLQWVKPRKTRALNIYMLDDNGRDFKLYRQEVGSKVMLQNLQSGKRYYFQLQAVNRAGKGPMSCIVSQIAA